jgi:hypothetical protein
MELIEMKRTMEQTLSERLWKLYRAFQESLDFHQEHRLSVEEMKDLMTFMEFFLETEDEKE